MLHKASQPWVVLKFGGTSVSSRETWETIAEQTRLRLSEGLRPLLVLSALSGISDMLERLSQEALEGRHAATHERLVLRHRELAASLCVPVEGLLDGDLAKLDRIVTGISLIGEVSPRLKAELMALGESMSTRLGAAYLQANGLSAGWLDVRGCLVSSEDVETSPRRAYLSATCAGGEDEGLKARLGAMPDEVLVTQGFIARAANGDTVLLGRGGSDTSAAYLAARLAATRCEIWTDVPGIFSADPRIIPQARMLRCLDYEEAQEIVTTGAKVLHPRCILPLKAAAIPILLKDTFHPDARGTVISHATPNHDAQVKAVSVKRGVTLISMDTVGMWQQVGFLADVFGCFKRHGLSVDLVSTSETNVTVTLDPTANPTDEETLRPLISDLSAYCRARVVSPCAAVGIVGRNIRAILHQLGPALEVFSEKQVHLVSQAASDLNLSLVVGAEDVDRLAAEVHKLFFGQRLEDSDLGPTWQQLVKGQQDDAADVAGAWWKERRNELLELAASNGTPQLVYDEETLDEAVAALQGLSPVSRVFYAVKANFNERILQRFHAAGLGFECVSTGELQRLLKLFPNLEPNRLLFTPNFAPRAEYEAAFAAQAIVTLDNLHPLQAWPELFARKEVFVRLDPGAGRGHHKHVHTAGVQSKFGIPPEQVDELSELAASAGAQVVGLHAHTGSGILSPDNWRENARFLVRMAERFPAARVLDLGGGLGIPEKPGQAPLDLEAVRQGLEEVKQAYPRFDLWLEPGRFLVGRAGVLLASATQLKRKGNQLYIGADVGMNTLIRPALYGAYHHIVNLSRFQEPSIQTASIVGPICESGDVLGAGRPMPHTEEGDVLLIATAGAYGRAMSSTYNLRRPAAESFLPSRTSPSSGMRRER